MMAANKGVRSLDDLRDKLRAFASERDWDQFHTPRNLAIAIAVEGGELLEIFQWMSETKLDLPHDIRLRIEEELADVLLGIVRLADVLNIELLAAADRKIESNAAKTRSRRLAEIRRSTRTCRAA